MFKAQRASFWFYCSIIALHLAKFLANRLGNNKTIPLQKKLLMAGLACVYRSERIMCLIGKP